MSPVESLHFAIGEMAYAIAMADGAIQKSEREKFAKIVAAEMRCENYGFDVANIIFQIMDKENHDAESACDSALRQMQLYSHYLSPEMKSSFVLILEKIAKAFPPVTAGERALIDKFKGELNKLEGDPIYYDAVNLKKAKWKR